MCKVWGCPVYVLEPSLQDGKKIPKWLPQSRRGQFLGFSLNHATTVGLIKNVITGYVSPQYHFVCDELFSTIYTDDEDVEAPNWEELFQFSRLALFDDHDDQAPPLDDQWLTEDELVNRRRRTAPQGIICQQPKKNSYCGTLELVI